MEENKYTECPGLRRCQFRRMMPQTKAPQSVEVSGFYQTATVIYQYSLQNQSLPKSRIRLQSSQLAAQELISTRRSLNKLCMVSDVTSDHVASLMRYLSASSLHQGLCYWMEVWLAAKKPMKKHQGCVVPLPIEDIIGQVDRVDTAGGVQ